jgi:archaellum component FlaC
MEIRAQSAMAFGLKDMIAEIGVVLNQASQAKRDIEDTVYRGFDDEDNLQKKLDVFGDALADANNNLDGIKDSLYKILEELEDAEYQAEFEAVAQEIR